jgi:small subunit ribosomal protein S21
VVFVSQVLVGENESLENALKRFKRKVQKDGIISDMKRKEEYVKPSVAKKIKSENARKRAKKEAKTNKNGY